MAKKRFNKAIIKKLAQKTRAGNSFDPVVALEANTVEQISHAVGVEPEPLQIAEKSSVSTTEIKSPKTRVKKTKIDKPKQKTAEELLAMDTVSFELELSNREYSFDTMAVGANEEAKRSLRQRILDWRKKNGAPKRLMGADSDDIPFAWKNPLIVTPKGTYTSRLIKQLNKENNSFSSEKLPSKTE